jgi:hypothetical protein
MVETLEEAHDITPVTDQGAAGVEAVFDLPPECSGLRLQGGHCREVLGEAFPVVVEVTTHPILKDYQCSIDIVEEFVNGFDKAKRLLCREYFE